MPEPGANPPASPQASPRVLELTTRETSPPTTPLGRWFSSGGRLDDPADVERGYPWYKVVCLTGVDYFSTLAYQPGIALIAAGMLAPTATLVLVAVTLLAALPVYAAVARRSFVGQGSIAMLENLLAGWKSKIFVLVLLGFAATDFVITMTLSAADAARHAVANPFLHPYLGTAQFGVTALLLLILAGVFFVGFREAINLAVVIVVPFLLLNLVVLGAGLSEILHHPELISQWRFSMLAQARHNDWAGVFLVSAILFPKLALGLSGFETGVSVMPLVASRADDGQNAIPLGRIRNTRKMLALAAAIMGFYLLLSSFVTTLLIPPAAYRVGGPAAGRAVAYLAQRMFGNAFGTLFDVSTILILWFAGASAMAGLINLVPRYLPRFGMAPRWVAYRRPMVAVLLVADLMVTFAFHANVEAQGGAYATGVLVLILSAAVAVTIAFWREFRHDRRRPSLLLTLLFGAATLVFVYTVVVNVIERPDGVIISAIFIVVILTFSALSRYQRARELRVAGMEFVDQGSAELWPSLVAKKVNLVPCHASGSAYRASKAEEIHHSFRVTAPLVFLHVNLLDNRSEFISRLRVSVRQEDRHYVIEVWGAVAIANTIAFVTELIDPISLFIMLSGRNLMEQSLRYALWGEGEVGLLVYAILVHYWEWVGRGADRPTLFLTTV
ncbi:MAG TPA: hypothetical protein VNJ52_01085 [Patescibacteria group bacterium]|nr:hypothetical protein [Patescibacteria group bacterium]